MKILTHQTANNLGANHNISVQITTSENAFLANGICDQNKIRWDLRKTENMSVEMAYSTNLSAFYGRPSSSQGTPPSSLSIRNKDYGDKTLDTKRKECGFGTVFYVTAGSSPGTPIGPSLWSRIAMQKARFWRLDQAITYFSKNHEGSGYEPLREKGMDGPRGDDNYEWG